MAAIWEFDLMMYHSLSYQYINQSCIHRPLFRSEHETATGRDMELRRRAAQERTAGTWYKGELE